MTAWDHSAWWVSLTEQQRREHNLKSALGSFKANLGQIEDLYNCHLLSADVTLKLTDRLHEALLAMEGGAAHFSLHLCSDVRARSDPKVVPL